MKRRVLGTPAVLASNLEAAAGPSRRSFTAADGAIGVGSVIYSAARPCRDLSRRLWSDLMSRAWI